MSTVSAELILLGYTIDVNCTLRRLPYELVRNILELTKEEEEEEDWLSNLTICCHCYDDYDDDYEGDECA